MNFTISTNYNHFVKHFIIKNIMANENQNQNQIKIEIPKEEL